MTPVPETTRRLSVALAVVAALAAAGTAFLPDVLSGPAVMNGSARGTAAVVLFVAVPALALSMSAARQGSTKALAPWVGAVAYLTYNAVMFAFGTPLNELFLLYVAMLSLGIWVLIGLASHALRLDVADAGKAPRWVGFYIGAVVALNALAWLRVVVPALVDDPTAALDGTGLTTSPLYIQDLAFWLPAMMWLACGLVKDLRQRLVPAAGGLFFWVVEAVGVAADQWAGHRADPASSVASGAAVPAFLALAAVGMVPLWAVLRALPARWASPIGAPIRS